MQQSTCNAYVAVHPLHLLLLQVDADRGEEPRPVVRVVDLGDRAEAQPELRAHDRDRKHHRLHEVVPHRRLIGHAEHLAVGGGGRRVPTTADHALHADGGCLAQSHIHLHTRVGGDPKEMHHVLCRELRLLERLLGGPPLRLVGGERALQPAVGGVDRHGERSPRDSRSFEQRGELRTETQPIRREKATVTLASGTTSGTHYLKRELFLARTKNDIPVRRPVTAGACFRPDGRTALSANRSFIRCEVSGTSSLTSEEGGDAAGAGGGADAARGQLHDGVLRRVPR